LKPFLKWAGGKYRLVPEIRGLLPEADRLIEPFVGSAALFLGTNYRRALLTDVNPDLIAVYSQLKEGGAGFTAQCADLFGIAANKAEIYYMRRDEFNRCEDLARRAALFVYLNKHCYNGLCRYSQLGKFNVPFGRYARVSFPESEMLAFAEKAAVAELRCCTFADALAEAATGDVVYCDPPYVPLSATANFTAYDRGGFSMSEQERLADAAEVARRRGAVVLISNHDTAVTRRLYAGASQLVTVSVQRNISRDAATRGRVRELLALYLPGDRRECTVEERVKVQE
jgi:DNA adenine methylase